MKWREKLNKMAMIDILFMLSDNVKERTVGGCPRELLTGLYFNDCELDCHKCLESLLNEEVERKGS